MRAEYVVRGDEKRRPSGHPSDPLPWLLGLPALEEVIRCRDCEWMDVIRLETNQPCSTEPNGFCSWAERREA